MTKAILMLVATGSSWVVVGAVVGMISRRGLNLLHYQIIGGVARIALSLAIGAFTSAKLLPPAGISPKIWAGVLAGCIAFGLFNYFMVQLMGVAMLRGPNAIVWAIIQSGFIYPFLMGWIVFHEPMSAGRVIGILMIIASIFLYAARGKANAAKGPAGPVDAARTERTPVRAWLMPALLGMLFCGLNQCGGSIPSHLPRGDEFPAIFRDIVTCAGGLVGCACGLASLGFRGQMPPLPTRREFALLTGFALGVISINYTAAVVLQFPALDLLKTYDRLSMGFPVTVAACIAAFFPYGLIVLHEKLNPIQALGAAVGIAGIVIGCL